ncbi:MAG: carbamoyltransferase C-terminal domain-containing protein, partial [Gemmatimonadota bacterium]
ARHVGHWAEVAGLRNVAVAGGVFANVHVNQVVHELPNVDRLFVHPGMGDGGLAVGAALAASVEGVADRRMAAHREQIGHVYLGPDLETTAVERALTEHGLDPEPLDDWEDLADGVAALLAAGHVVARAAGRMEYGPRALGNRSILYQPTDPSVNDWLNANLKRTEFMPFAPSVMWEERHRCFEGLSGADHAAQFMTVTFNCTDWMSDSMPGVVHIDGTARPQLVRRETSAGYYAIIDAFHRRTGLPGIINTSFNMHEEPIVCSADDCVRAFLAAKLDYLAIGPHLVKHPDQVARELRPVRTDPGLEGRTVASRQVG